MLKKLFATALLLAFTVTANATPIKSGITGQFGMTGEGTIEVNDKGEFISIFFDFLDAGTPKADDFSGKWKRNDAVSIESPLNIANALDKLDNNKEVKIFELAGFEFILTGLRGNTGNKLGNVYSTNLFLLGMLSHDDYITTEAEFHFSSQGLSLNPINNKSQAFSVSVTSPAPVDVSEPGTLAIFGLALVGFAATRKKKSA
jgi:hypothetical protein